MLRKGTLHIRDPDAASDGTYLAVTMINRPPHGVMVWAGRLYADAKDKPGAQIEQGDYASVEKVSFSVWSDVWEYFAGRHYAPLLTSLRSEVEVLYPGE
ncbi:MAG: hypothetical protein WAS23_00955 [Dokdonella sp.]|uniref:hypothetical protein n=1 Tax=Dokdonella sp. TaxID=2291710 RepID=UPI003BB128D9